MHASEKRSVQKLVQAAGAKTGLDECERVLQPSCEAHWRRRRFGKNFSKTGKRSPMCGEARRKQK